jgi:hypothetical protein
MGIFGDETMIAKRLFIFVAGAMSLFAAAEGSAAEGGVPVTVDYSLYYDLGGVPNIGRSGADNQGNTTPIVDINLGLNVDSVLGCSGVDIGGLIQNTFNVGDIGSEFSNYLQTTLAREALTLVYSSPAVSAVLDGLKAVGHARASILQEKCDANEIMANARNRRLRSEGYQRCLAEHDQVHCDNPSNLSQYITQVAQTQRWSGTLHDFLCDSSQQNCDWLRMMPNFAYDMGENQGRTANAAVGPTQMFDRADRAAGDRLRERVQRTRQMIEERGVAETMRALAGTTEDGAGTAPAGDPPAAAAAADGSGTQDSSLAWQQLLGNACIDEESGRSLTDVTAMLNGTNPGDAFGNIDRIIEGTARCIVDQEIHPHVDVRISLLPQVQQEGMLRSLSQAIAARASVNVMNAIIFKMAETLATRGSAEGDGANTMNRDMRDFALMQIENFKSMRDALVQTLQSYKDIAERVATLNRQMNEAAATISSDFNDSR